MSEESPSSSSPRSPSPRDSSVEPAEGSASSGPEQARRGPAGSTPFGRYRLQSRIGSGGMAEIFRAVAMGAQGFERTVAIKRIRDEVVELADIGKLFADEARVSALLDHPNIVQVYDFGAVDGTYYIAMEYLKGRNLEQVLSALRERGQRLAPSLAVLIARDVARGLAYAHGLADDKGRPLAIVHRDVSPANVMLSHMGAVKLLDFGIARITSELRLAVTRGRALRGKCPYLAPEQITNEGEADARSDIFALGAVLWEMLTGRRLFVGSSDFEVLASVLNRDLPPPSSMVPGLPAEVDEIVLHALARDPDQRFASAGALAEALEEAVQLLPSRYRDLTSLVANLPPQPTEELRLPVAPPLSDDRRFEIVLPALPTPAALVGIADPTSLEQAGLRNEETRKVSSPELLARLSRNPDRRPTLPGRVSRTLLFTLGVALLMFVENLTSLIQPERRLPTTPRQATAAEVVVLPSPPPPPVSPPAAPPVPLAPATDTAAAANPRPAVATSKKSPPRAKRASSRGSRPKAHATRRPYRVMAPEARSRSQPIAQGRR